MRIHPTALVNNRAQLGAEVDVGPYSIVGAEAIIGDNCIIQSHVVIEGAVKMGSGNFVGHGTVIGTAPQDLSFDAGTESGVEIGSANVIREHCTIHRGSAEGSATVLGDRNFLLVGAHVGHDCKVGNGVVMANDSLLGGHVSVADGAFLGGGSMFHQHVRVGRLALAQGRTTRSVPPFVTAVANYALGINAVGLRRAGLSTAERDEIKRAFRLLYTSGLNRTQAMQKAKEENFASLGQEFFDFVANAGKRGFVSYRASLESDE
ncbi:MAG: acyl-ACP--UDP-N-acetylglucosamine O-acyltransferase [Verrucomicrobiota bacterium]